jgi:glycosyltransferase involved in cell wall biosynthesis
MHHIRRVAVVSPVPFGREGIVGGGERYALELAKALAHEVPTRLITFGAKDLIHHDDTCPKLEVHVHATRHFGSAGRADPRVLRFIGSLLDVDVVHLIVFRTMVANLSIMLAKITGKRVFVTDVSHGGHDLLAARLPMAKLVDGFLLLSEFGARFFPGYEHKIKIIHGGVDPRTYVPPLAPRRGNILFVGRLIPHKGINYLLEGVDRETQVRIVGTPYNQEYMCLLKRLSIDKQVVFLSGIGDNELVSEYQTAGVTVLPSVYDTVYGDHVAVPELLGLVLLESMACGTPVIGTSVGAIPEFVVDGVTGYIVPPNDARAIGDCIRDLLREPERVERMGRNGRQMVLDQFTWSGVAARCLSAYEARSV